MFDEKPFDTEWERMTDRIDNFKKNFWKNLMLFLIDYLFISVMIALAFTALAIFGKTFKFSQIFTDLKTGLILGFIGVFVYRHYKKKQKVEIIPPPKIEEKKDANP